MNSSKRISSACTVLVLVLGLIPEGPVRAACPPIDFENLAAGTAVTTQYPGVTFSVRPQSCSSTRTLYMRIYTPPNGTSSGVKCIKIDTGCPDFSDDYLRMVFSTAVSEVTFTLGDWAATYEIRYYSTTTGTTGLLGSFDVVIGPPNGGDVGVYTPVRVSTGSRNIRRVEVEEVVGQWEAIDDLAFDLDVTPPIAEITTPSQLACVCSPSEIIGSAYDPDGPITEWRLHRKALGATSWVLIRQSTTEIIDGALATWSTAAADGYYTLRLTVESGCELQTVWTTDVWLDQTFNSLLLRSPVNGAILGGTICADGTAWDHCGGIIEVERRPAAGGAWQPFDSVSPPWVITDPLGSWNTRAVGDGNYLVRLTGTDDCGNSASAQVTVTVDNTSPKAVITAPTACSAMSGLIQVRGTAFDDHIDSWVLQYTGDNTHGWVTLASGNASVLDGLLAVWDTTGLPPCAYTLRLLVTDKSVLDCNGALRNQSEYLQSLTLVGDALAQDTDADGMPDIWENEHGFNPNNPLDAGKDADGDGLTNLGEYQAGTDPRDPDSALRITDVSPEGEDARVTWTAEGGHHYLLLGGASLDGGVDEEVSPLISVPLGAPPTVSYLHAGGATIPEQFYRVRLAP